MAGRISPPDQPLDASRFRFTIVAGRFHEHVTARLVEGALDCLEKHGVANVPVEWVPGSFELPLAAQAIAERGDVDAVVAIGCVVRGETPHFEFVSSEAARGLMDVMLDTGVPVSFGVLTTDTMEQAQARAGGSAGNKGWDAALGAIEMAALLRKIEEPGR
ncbi:MAG: 6,7-dimethyl-8-ribityllumazine synthase [Actinobacteria bacterium]|nr:6,7-dimethyl-8-ribityllumazine synthase [Actinomycetota bacterium]